MYFSLVAEDLIARMKEVYGLSRNFNSFSIVSSHFSVEEPYFKTDIGAGPSVPATLSVQN